MSFESSECQLCAPKILSTSDSLFACEYSFMDTVKKDFFDFKPISHVMGYHDGKKYDILAFKWRVLSILSILDRKLFQKTKGRFTLVKCTKLHLFVRFLFFFNLCKSR